MKKVFITGNPNTGKTSLFNALTGAQRAVGNWAGVTVEVGRGTSLQQNIQFYDLPGCYTLVSHQQESGPQDEALAADFLSTTACDVLLNLVDARQLQRQLYLTLQLLERELPVVIVLINSADPTLADFISQHLHCPSLLWREDVRQDRQKLERCLNDYQKTTPTNIWRLYCPAYIQNWLESPAEPSFGERIQALEADSGSLVAGQQQALDEQMAQARHEWLQTWLKKKPAPASTTQGLSQRLDNLFLHPLSGLPIFFGLMYLMFAFAIQGGGWFKDGFEALSEHYVLAVIQNLSLPALLQSLCFGAAQGLHTTLSFAPIIACMYLFLSFLEFSGYMSRVAFLMDKLMLQLGLPGKSFVPLIVGFGCNVPAVMGARTLANLQERILTIMMAPFISCGARLTIYAVFAAAFFPRGGDAIIFGLYCLGLGLALMTGLLLRQTLLRAPPAPFVLDLPAYQWPNTRRLFRVTLHKVRRFLVKAGLLIIPLCMGVGLLSGSGPLLESPLVYIGQKLTPLFAPMGIQADNWPATVGLLSGVVAKEVVIGTLTALYSQSPVTTSGQHLLLGEMMQAHFHELSAVIAYLVFVLLYFPCVSVVAAVAKELDWRWASFSLVWSTFLAYSMASACYQAAHLVDRPLSASLWLVGLLLANAAFWWATNRWGRHLVQAKKFQPLPTPITLTT